MDPPPSPEADITFEVIGRGYTPMDEDVDDRYSVPTLEELGNDYFKHSRLYRIQFKNFVRVRH